MSPNLSNIKGSIFAQTNKNATYSVDSLKETIPTANLIEIKVIMATVGDEVELYKFYDYKEILTMITCRLVVLSNQIKL